MNSNKPKPDSQPSEPAGKTGTSKNEPGKGPQDKAAATRPAPVAAQNPGPVTPLFRKVDWVAFAITTLISFAGYFYTMAPDVTLQDSGELAVGSFYAGVPHPPGYPVWTMLTWLFTELIPFSNIAWRVTLASAVCAAISAGLIALLVSRGCSQLLGNLESLAAFEPKWERIFCVLSGYVAGMLLAFNGFMWSQAVIVEVYTPSVLSLMITMAFLLRWMYAQHQYRYLYLALFTFGVCFTNHQTLLLAAMGIEVCIVVARPALGRDMLFFNSLIYLVGLILRYSGNIKSFESAPGQVNMMFVIFNIVGVCSVIGFFYLLFRTKKLFTELKATLISALMWVLGAGLYLFMPIASMANPPMNWGYPRQWDGFLHALTRGQYEKANPSNMFSDPVRFINQLRGAFESMVGEMTFFYILLGLIPFIFIGWKIYTEGGRKHIARIGVCIASMICVYGLIVLSVVKFNIVGLGYLFWLIFFVIGAALLYFLMDLAYLYLQRLERAWLMGLVWIFLGLFVLLLIMLNPQADRQSQELNKVFMTASHVMVSMFIGYGIYLAAAFLAVHYQQFRFPALLTAAVGAGLALFAAVVVFSDPNSPNPIGGFFELEPSKSFIVRLSSAYGLGLSIVALAVLALARSRAPLALLAVIYFLMPAKTIIPHWEDNEQRGHLFGYWFGHDMFTPPFNGKDGRPLYPEMDRDTVLFGGTDPGRFNPTYMIFCESFIPPKCKPHDPQFDRRDVYLITQNALADNTYLNYIRAHYNRSAQQDRPFFEDAFDSLHFSAIPGMKNLARALDNFFLKFGDRVEKRRRAGTSYFKETDFLDLAGFAKKLQDGEPRELCQYLKSNLSPATQQLLATPGPKLAKMLAADLNKLLEKELIYTTNRFAGVTLKPGVAKFLAQNPQSHTRIRLNRQLLECAFPKEIAVSPGGVYPDREILTPTVEDSQRCFQEYLEDVQKRMQRGQLRPGEDVKTEGGRVQVSGQVAVMAINALLTKVIFDKNPDHAFYVEESFPLDWMYPYLTPYGIIMKINRQPLPELTQDILERDHEFWCQYSTRLIGNWITYDTPISNICQFAESVYLHRDYSQFNGDRKFIRDSDAQKAFSKLRSSIGGVYAWRVQNSRTPEERERMFKEAEFAFKQALAFCPYSPEAVFRYINLLLGNNPSQRADDALLIARTCKKLDPGNPQLDDLIRRLEAIKRDTANMAVLQSQLGQLRQQFDKDPNVSNAFQLAQVYLSMQRTGEAVQVFLRALSDPRLDASGAISIANAFVQLNQLGPLETALNRLVQISPDSPEGNYDLAAVESLLNKPSNAIVHLRTALTLSANRLKADPKAKNLMEECLKDTRFNSLRSNPDFQKLLDQFR